MLKFRKNVKVVKASRIRLGGCVLSGVHNIMRISRSCSIRFNPTDYKLVVYESHRSPQRATLERCKDAVALIHFKYFYAYEIMGTLYTMHKINMLHYKRIPQVVPYLEDGNEVEGYKYLVAYVLITRGELVLSNSTIKISNSTRTTYYVADGVECSVAGLMNEFFLGHRAIIIEDFVYYV